MAFDRKAYMKEYQKAWYLKNKLRLKQKMKENRENNLERDKKRSRDWYWNHRELSLERVKTLANTPENKLKKRKKHLKSLYGLSLDEYNNMFDKQDGKCYICRTPQSELKVRLHVDHNHTTGKIRKLLCQKCNMSIGLLNDDITLVYRLLEYLTNE